MNKNMKFSANCLFLTKAFESCKLKAYPDVRGVWTIGWGHTAGVKAGDACNQSQADTWLEEELIISGNQILSALHGITLNQNQFDALVDFVYNEGSGHFDVSTVKRRLMAGYYIKAADALLLWYYAGGAPYNGLLRRRYAERALFLGDFRVDGSLKIEFGDFPDVRWPAPLPKSSHPALNPGPVGS